jgi:hypothetical protein
VVKNRPLVGLSPTKPASEAACGEVIKDVSVPEDKTRKATLKPSSGHDRRKPLARRIIEAVKARAPRKTRERETKKKRKTPRNLEVDNATI